MKKSYWGFLIEGTSVTSVNISCSTINIRKYFNNIHGKNFKNLNILSLIFQRHNFSALSLFYCCLVLFFLFFSLSRSSIVCTAAKLSSLFYFQILLLLLLFQHTSYIKKWEHTNNSSYLKFTSTFFFG